jgi:hypothetical protein
MHLRRFRKEFETPYSWWGYTTPSIYESTVASTNGLTKNLKIKTLKFPMPFKRSIDTSFSPKTTTVFFLKNSGKWSLRRLKKRKKSPSRWMQKIKRRKTKKLNSYPFKFH